MKKLNKLKRIVCGLLAGITVLGATQTTAFAANPTVSSVGSTAAYTATSHYTDVPQGAYYAKAVEWARGKGITSDQTNKFCPKDNIKRGDYVLMLYRLEGSPAKPLHDEATEQIVAEFGDVSTSAYYYNAVCWGVRCDVIGGCSDGKFHPTDSITNKEAIQFLYAAAKSNKVYKIKATATTAGKLAKTWKATDWYYEACEWANNKGYLASVPDFAAKNKFLSNAKTTRALMVYLLWEMQTGNYSKYAAKVEKMMQVAEGEDGKTNGSKYGTSGAWCAAFASWCAKEVGLASTDATEPSISYAYPVLRNYGCSAIGQQFCSQRHLFVPTDTYKTNSAAITWGRDWRKAVVYNSAEYNGVFTPLRGDFIIFADANHKVQHIGLVKDAYPNSNGTYTIITIEGNSCDKVNTLTYSNVNLQTGATGRSGNTSYIAGFGRVF